MEILNFILLFVTVTYGIVYGVRNWALGFIGLFGSGTRQSTLGNILDGLFMTAVLYFLTYGKTFIATVIAGA